MPGYQPGMVPAPMPMMPAMGTVPAMPGKAGLGAPESLLRRAVTGGGRVLLGVPSAQWAESFWPRCPPLWPPAALTAMVVPPQPPLPSLDAGQLAIQQQNFINQQALILVSAGRALGLPGGGRSMA